MLSPLSRRTFLAGTAGLAGLIQLTRDGIVGPDENVAVIFSGARRSSDAPSS